MTFATSPRFARPHLVSVAAAMMIGGATVAAAQVQTQPEARPEAGGQTGAQTGQTGTAQTTDPAQRSQPATPRTDTPAQMRPGEPVADAEIRAFAAAAVDLRDIAMQTDQQLQAMQDDAAREELQRQATQQMVDAVQSRGLSVESYNDIASRAQEDTQLARRITDEIEAIQSN
jgi:hypothetical protein